jgi:hypothetical protein
MEVSIFPRSDIAAVLKKLIEARLHTDKEHDDEESKRSARFQALKVRLTGSEANPIYVIVDPSAPEKVLDTFPGADLSGERFRAFLERNVR